MYAVHYVGVRAQCETPSLQGRKLSAPIALSQAPIRLPGEIEFIAPDGITHQTLSAPGEYLVLNVKRGSAVLAVSKYVPAALHDKVNVHWRIDPIDAGRFRSPQQQAVREGVIDKSERGRTLPGSISAADRQPPPPPKALSGSRALIQLVGHIERRGDATAATGEWLGDPAGTARLEGLQVLWQEKPASVDIIIACQAGERRMQARTGAFIGTRQQAAPITQLAICLQGAGSEGYRLEGEAAFSDGSRHLLGSPQAVLGSRGSHLVAVRLAVQPMVENTPATPGSATRSAWLDPELTHITQAGVGA